MKCRHWCDFSERQESPLVANIVIAIVCGSNKDEQDWIYFARVF